MVQSIQDDFKVNTRHNKRRKLLETFLRFLLPIISVWATYEEMHFIPYNTLRQFAFPVFGGWTNTFLVDAVGDMEKRNGFLAISFFKFSQTGILPIKTKNALRNERKTSKYFCQSSSWLLSENCYVHFRLQKCVCVCVCVQNSALFFFQYFCRY